MSKFYRTAIIKSTFIILIQIYIIQWIKEIIAINIHLWDMAFCIIFTT